MFYNRKKVLLFIHCLIFIISCGTNFEPEINSISAEPNPVFSGETVTLNCFASDDDEPNILKNESIDYTWFAAYGNIIPKQSPEMVTWIAPQDSGEYSISCKVSDQYNGVDIATIEIIVE